MKIDFKVIASFVLASFFGFYLSTVFISRLFPNNDSATTLLTFLLIIILFVLGFRWISPLAMCPSCHFLTKSLTARFCPKCGDKLINECPDCKCGIIKNASFCSRCGSSLNHKSSIINDRTEGKKDE